MKENFKKAFFTIFERGIYFYGVLIAQGPFYLFDCEQFGTPSIFFNEFLKYR